jgi:hypothetical protein
LLGATARARSPEWQRAARNSSSASAPVVRGDREDHFLRTGQVLDTKANLELSDEILLAVRQVVGEIGGEDPEPLEVRVKRGGRRQSGGEAQGQATWQLRVG